MWTLNTKELGFLLLSSMACWAMSVFGAIAQHSDFYPTYYEVYNVASNDVLNARADSDSEAPIVGSLSHDDPLVEVVRQEHNWGYVALGESMGWVSMNFLRQIDPPKVGQSPFPVNLSCGGTEPFWGFHLGEEEVYYSHMDGDDMTLTITDANGFSGFAGQNGYVQAAGENSLFTATFNSQQCSDGMSDLDYGWKVDVVLNGANETRGFSGCCRLVEAP